jgi:hypothetical protein
MGEDQMILQRVLSFCSEEEKSSLKEEKDNDV